MICEVLVGTIGNTSFELNFTLRNRDKIAAKVKTKHVMVKKEEFVKSPIPVELLTRLKENQH